MKNFLFFGSFCPAAPQAIAHKIQSWLLLFLALWLSGCATHEIPKVNLDYLPQDFNVRRQGDAAERSLGLLPVTDRRPETERQGATPGAVYLLVYNARVGEYVTGDNAIEGDLTEKVRDGLKAAFDRANLFREVRDIVMKDEIRNSPLAEQLFMAQSGVDYLLEVSVQHAAARQHQHSSFGAVPAVYVNAVGWTDNMGRPDAETELRVKLYDAKSGYPVLDERIHGVAAPEASNDMAQAFRSAIQRAIEQSVETISNQQTILTSKA